ncbi:MFS general substrate transporter [Mycena leptocephala]|nr:MFS general substrate transporter [Mycena leptocephala]
MPELLSEIPSLARKSPEISMQGFHPVLSNHDLDKKDTDGDVEVQPSASSPVNADEFPDCGAWIGSIQRCMVFITGVFVGRLFDLGFFRVTFVTGSLLVIAGTFLIPVCKVYWHFLLCQGFMVGVGFGLTFGPSATVITHWWKKRRGFAFGVAASGSAVGGVFLPIFMREALPIVGFAWTLRIIEFVLIFTFGVANLVGAAFPLFLQRCLFHLQCLARRLPPYNAEGVGAYLTSTAVSYGLSLNFAFYLVAIHNGALLFGAVLFGLYGDLIGAMNALLQGIVVIGVITVVWPFCGTVASLSVISILYGISLGAFSALEPVPVAAMGGTEDLGRRIGIINTVRGLGTLCGPPLGGLLVSTNLGYKAVGYFAGGMVFLGAMFFALARYLAVPRLRAKF